MLHSWFLRGGRGCATFLSIKVWRCLRVHYTIRDCHSGFLTMKLLLIRPNRHQGCVPSIRVVVLCLWNRVIRQWTGDIRNYTSIRGGSRQILRECEFVLMWMCFLGLLPIGVRTGPVSVLYLSGFRWSYQRWTEFSISRKHTQFVATCLNGAQLTFNSRSWTNWSSLENYKSHRRSPYFEWYVQLSRKGNRVVFTHHQVTQSDSVEEQENSEDTMARLSSRSG